MSRVYENYVSQITNNPNNVNNMTAKYFTEKQIAINIGMPESDLTPIQRLFKHLYKDEHLKEHIDLTRCTENVIKLKDDPFHIVHWGEFYELETYVSDRVVVFKTKFYDRMIDYLREYILWNK